MHPATCTDATKYILMEYGDDMEGFSVWKENCWLFWLTILLGTIFVEIMYLVDLTVSAAVACK